MHYVFCRDSSVGEAALVEALTEKLREGSVLWLLSGGSNVGVETRIIDKIDDELTQNLTVMLADERYGVKGHADSNWEQLLAAGFNSKQAYVVDALPANMSLDESAEAYDKAASRAFHAADYVIAQLGIGPDGHVAGILPDSPAAVDTDKFVIGYESDPHQRMTLTFQALQRANAGYVFAFGDNKKQAFENLEQRLTLSEQPAQILKALPEAYVYNDQLGGEV
jgi:6-phosphogluconolactonase/glucosamine-6-phosphate isomerase/deaminase